jgi:hypothetical protein
MKHCIVFSVLIAVLFAGTGCGGDDASGFGGADSLAGAADGGSGSGTNAGNSAGAPAER